jgi:hypothetical protein
MRHSTIVLVLVLLPVACGGGGGSGGDILRDTTPPAAISDLSVSALETPGAIELTWTATGDDGRTGTADSYVLACSTDLARVASFDPAVTEARAWPPLDPNAVETRTITGLAQGQTVYLALKVRDEVPNTSGISNIVSVTVPDGALALAWFGGGEAGWQTDDDPKMGWDLHSFARAAGLATSGDGHLYVAEFTNDRVSKWTTDGTPVGWIGGGADGWQTGNAPPPGSDARSFHQAEDVCVDGSGNLYVVDRSNCRICKWDAQGNALGWIGGGQDGWRTDDATGWGTDLRSFSFPSGMALAPDGTIYVADTYNHRISKWSAQGQALGWIGGGSDGWQTGDTPTRGADARSFEMPFDVALDPNGDLVVSDTINRRLCRWSSTGTSLGWIGGGQDGWRSGDAPPHGFDLQSFYAPSGLTILADGTIYVTDQLNGRISKWRREGTAVGWIGGGSDGWQTGDAPSNGQDVRSFVTPRGVVHDGSTRLYVADDIRICIWEE